MGGWVEKSERRGGKRERVKGEGWVKAERERGRSNLKWVTLE